MVRFTAPAAAQQRFHRYVAVLFATTAPLVAVVEIWRASDSGIPWIRLLGPLVLTVWAVIIVRSEAPNAVPLVLGGMVYVGTVSIIEVLLGVDATSFEFASSFGLMMLLSVLAGTLALGSRLVWAGGLAAAVATWVVALGLSEGDPVDVVGVRAIIAVAGVVFTTALVAELYDQLTASIRAHDRSRRLQEAVGKCSEALLVHSDAFALQEAVRAVFEATDADYAYVDRTMETDEGLGWEIVASASRRVGTTGNHWQTGIYNSIPTTYEAMKDGRSARIHTKELKGRERGYYQDDGILSELSVPIYIGEEFRGSIGFVEYTEERSWSDDEVQTLWRAADMIGAYWRRHDDAEALKASNESKDKLLASVSHEIRTPLTAIVGLSETLVSDRDQFGDDEVRELNRIIAVQSRELAELVEDLLVASRADFGNLSIRPEPIDLEDQVTRVVEGLRESTPTHKSIEFAKGSSTAWADPLRVRQIIRNLVTNAIKYGGDRIAIAILETDETSTVVVSDNGVGVAEREAKLIFERYYRSEQSPTQPGSVGIGLAVSRQLAEMMGGTLRYVAGPDNHRFELSLPHATSSTLVPEPA